MTKPDPRYPYHGSELAIVGRSGRFPGARSVAELWRNLRAGVESIRRFTAAELEAAGADPAWIELQSFVNAGGVVDGVDELDAAFFGFSPREAEVTDPEQRLFLECAWEALEDAGHDPGRFPGAIGVFAGSGLSGYLFNLISNPEAMDALGWFRTVLGNDKDYLATWVSYRLDLKGPSLSVQTACSTSLVATHMACQSLLNGECDLALAGGVSLSSAQTSGYFYQEGGIQSPDGHCRAFDAAAGGSVPSNGVGVVVLRRLADAEADGDRIRAVIKGSAINNDGSQKLGFTAPSIEGQSRVISEAMAMAEVDPETVGYVEAHGTGTRLGDPVEVAALTRAFRAHTGRTGFCALGSVKTNIGHLDAAAGVAGLIKTTLALEHRELPPTLHFRRPNPELELADSPFVVHPELTPWESLEGVPRRAGVSSFGLGGTNAHVVLEEAPPAGEPDPSRPAHALVLSATTATALDAAGRRLAERLAADNAPEEPLADVAYTLQVGRRAFPHRRVVICRDRAGAIAALEGRDPKRVATAHTEHRAREVAFLLPGQGTQYPGMGREIYDTEPVFRRHLDRCAELLEPHLGTDLRRLLYPAEPSPEAAAELRRTDRAQPAIFALEIALARTLMDWGIRPAAMLGHSLGEYTAACLAGVFGLEDALALVAERGRLMQELPPGAMLSVALSEEETVPYLEPELALAALNHPTSTVVSGRREAVAALHARLEAEGIQSFPIETSHAGHSPLLGPMAEALGERLAAIELRPPEIPFFSNRTGGWITAEQATDPSYWAEHLLHTVRFNQGIEELYRQPARVLLEVGPGTTLGAFARWHPGRGKEQPVYSTMRHPEIERSDAELLQEVVGRLWLAGVAVDWPRLYEGERRRRVPLPTYPFERRRFWVEPGTGGASLVGSQAGSAARGDLSHWFYTPSWKRSFPPPRDPGAPLPGPWVILAGAGDGGLGTELAAELGRRGARAVTVRPGDRFAELDDGGYTLDPAAPSDYRALVRRLWQGDDPPRRVVHLWSLGDPGSAQSCQRLGFYSLFHLGQALGEAAPAEEVTVGVVADGLLAVTGEEELRPEKATLLGATKILPVEIENLRCRTLDLPSPAADTDLGRRAASVIDELGDDGEAIVAHRGASRWIQIFEPLTLVPAEEPPACLRRGGVYLIVGGLGGIGLELAGYLARTVGARLVLTARTPLPTGKRREVWLERHGPEDPTSARLLALRALEDAGAEVMVAAVDAADRDGMAALVARARDRFGRVHGVIHAAGPPPGRLAMLESTDSLEEQLSSKLDGMRVIDDLLDDGELDFLFLCSSLNAVRPLPGRLAYCGANAYLDAFAHSRTGGRTFVQSVNWDTWREVGMAVDEARRMGLDPEESIRGGISPAEGVEAFVRALRRGLPQLVVSHRDFVALMREAEGFTATRAREELEAARPAGTAHPRPELSTPYQAPRDENEAELAEIWQRLLGVERVGVHDDFFELGGDSVVSIQVTARARRAGIALTPRQVFDLPTIAELAAAAGSGPEIVADQGVITGPVPLTPVQHRFFERPRSHPEHWNQSVLLEAAEPIDADLLRRLVGSLLAHHDALRLGYRRPPEGGVEQELAPFDPAVPVAVVDLSALPAGERQRRRVAASEALQRGFDLARPPLLWVALFDLGADSQRLLIILHHLVVDALSWQILLEDLEVGYRQLRAGGRLELPAKTTSFKRWAERLAAHADSEPVRGELETWSAEPRRRIAPLPVDFPRGVNRVTSVRSVSARLSAEETAAVLQEIPQRTHAQPQEILLAALARSVAAWTGQRLLLVDQEGHGREPLFPEVDVSRTVGWFTSIYPILIDFEAVPDDLLAELRAAKEQLRALPAGGIGYGLLRYLAPERPEVEALRQMPAAQLSFVYLGQLGRSLSAGAERPESPFRPADEPHGASQDPGAERHWLLELASGVRDDRLEMVWSYSEELHRRSTVEALAAACADALRALVDRCRDAGAEPLYTPSDFTQVELDQEQLDELMEKLGDR